MDEGSAREHAERHASLFLEGDLSSAFSYLTGEAQAQIEPYVLNFPSPVETAEVVSLALQPEGWVVLLQLSGGGRELEIRATWEDVGGRAMIAKIEGTESR